MKLYKNIILGLGVVLLAGVVASSYLRFAEKVSYERKGMELVEKVESYYYKYEILPKTAKELDFIAEVGEGPYYEKISDLKYSVYFSIGFDDAYVYYSDTKKWKYFP